MSTHTKGQTGLPSASGFAASTLVELLRLRAGEQAGLKAYAFLKDGETEDEGITYGQLDARARAVAARLQELGMASERALLLYPPGLDYIAAFFGCLYAGAVAVPAYPPDPDRLHRSITRLLAILKDAGPRVVLTTSSILSMIRRSPGLDDRLTSLGWVTTDTLEDGLADEWMEPDISGRSLAFLQYTSGSTGSPRGVMVSHGNILHNEWIIQTACRHDSESTFVGWLPLYHDMGLIGNVLQPLYIGAQCVLMSPLAFLQKPLRWLSAISRYRAATSGGPNFAYDLCVRKVKPSERAELDLSSWTTAFNGAEPIRSETVERFINAFEPCGFRRETFFPCYGLAEATLIVSGGSRESLPVVRDFEAAELERNRVAPSRPEGPTARTLAGCGRVLQGHDAVIADPDSLALCPPDRVGEIWLAGESIAQGYWKRPEETEHTFNAFLSDSGEGPYLRTGDLGFIKDGELFVTGRLKDLIIIRGRNHYPQDIEMTVEKSHPALRPGCGAAFSIDVNGEEKLVIVQEADPKKAENLPAIIDSIRSAVSEKHELQAHTVVLVKPWSIPKTSSGKIQRRACRTAFLRSELEVFEKSPDQTAPEQDQATKDSSRPSRNQEEAFKAWLTAELALRLQVSPNEIDPERPLTLYGLDSLMALELSHAIQERLGREIPLGAFFNDASIARIASELVAMPEAAAPSPIKGQAPGEGRDAARPLSHGQRSLWVLQELAEDSPVLTIASAARIRAEVDPVVLKESFQALVDRHECLRTTFKIMGGEPVQVVHDHSEIDFRRVDASGQSEESLLASLKQDASRPFDLGRGPLLRVTLFTRSGREHVLLIAVHHLVSDFGSLANMMKELGILYSAGRRSARAGLPPLNLQFADYVGWQEKFLASERGRMAGEYWRERLSGELPVLNLPTDRPRPPVLGYRGASVSFKVSESITRRIRELAGSRGATLHIALLAAFEVFLYRHSGQEELLVGSPTSGRSRKDFKDLSGYFVNILPIRADLSSRPTFAELLDRTRRAVLDAYEHQDYPLALMSERLQPDRSASRPPLLQAVFTFQKTRAGNDDSLAGFAIGEAGGKSMLGELPVEIVPVDLPVSQYELTMHVAELDGGLSASLQYNTDLFDRETIVRMTERFQILLESISSNPDLRISELPMLGAAERRRLLVEWNQTQQEYPSDTCIHTLVEQQAELTPQALAVADQKERLSYRELNEEADRLSGFLTDLGVGPESRVAVCLPRSSRFVVSLLAILKSGAAYLPLDPSYPRARLAFMVEDSAASALLTDSAGAAMLSGLPVTTLNLDDGSLARA
ncbi:MAG TPA: condensation domain-containing protein, partial [Blastocatellia bacterium]|nr:condensation domain-containing protein [Blastocatellia bacterium]